MLLVALEKFASLSRAFRKKQAIPREVRKKSMQPGGSHVYTRAAVLSVSATNVATWTAQPAAGPPGGANSSAGATVLGFGLLLIMLYMPWSLIWGKRASANPWGAKGLEWETSSPPPMENFEVIPEVTEGAYNYAEVDDH